MFFNCEVEIGKGMEKWTGQIKNFTNCGNCYEIFIESRSSIRVIFGKTSLGGFACIPDFEAGCHLVGFEDKFWNIEKLSSAIGKVDGITVAEALCKLSKTVFFNR